MKPVMQTVTGPTGNCMGACLASILEVPIEVVPNFFDAGPDDADWWNALRAWLRGFGLGIITLTFESPAQWRHLRLSGYHIVSGPSPRLEGMHHATVWHQGQMVHDPHPDGGGIVQPETLDMLYLLDPSRLQLPASVIAAELRGNAGVLSSDQGGSDGPAAPKLSWCHHCGEGITTFCRGALTPCPKGLSKATADGVPASTKGGA